MASILILTGATIDRETEEGYAIGVSSYEEEIRVNNLLDEMKFEAFVAGMNKKSLEEIQNFFNNKKQ